MGHSGAQEVVVWNIFLWSPGCDLAVSVSSGSHLLTILAAGMSDSNQNLDASSSEHNNNRPHSLTVSFSKDMVAGLFLRALIGT